MDPKKGCQWESKRSRLNDARSDCSGVCTDGYFALHCCEESVGGVAQAKHWEEREEANYMAEWERTPT